MKEETVSVKDGRLFYRLEGRGDPLILLHSLGLSSESWRHVIGPLSKRFSVYALDLMGFGNSDKPDKNYEIRHYAESIIEFMDKLGINKASVIGNSIGAIISLEMAASFPRRLVKQVLVGCLAWATAWERLEYLMTAAFRYDTNGMPKTMTMADLSLTYVHPTTEILEWNNRLRAKAGLWCKKAHIAIGLWDVVPKLPMVSCPTLIVFGSKDYLRSAEQVLIQGIKGTKYALIEDTGHSPQIESPEAFLKPVMQFL